MIKCFARCLCARNLEFISSRCTLFSDALQKTSIFVQFTIRNVAQNKEEMHHIDTIRINPVTIQKAKISSISSSLGSLCSRATQSVDNRTKRVSIKFMLIRVMALK